MFTKRVSIWFKSPDGIAFVFLVVTADAPCFCGHMPIHIRQDESSFPDRGPPLTKLLWVLTSLAFLTVVLRFSFRLRKKQFGWDDLFMALTMVCVDILFRSDSC